MEFRTNGLGNAGPFWKSQNESSGSSQDRLKSVVYTDIGAYQQELHYSSQVDCVRVRTNIPIRGLKWFLWVFTLIKRPWYLVRLRTVDQHSLVFEHLLGDLSDASVAWRVKLLEHFESPQTQSGWIRRLWITNVMQNKIICNNISVGCIPSCQNDVLKIKTEAFGDLWINLWLSVYFLQGEKPWFEGYIPSYGLTDN